jgi:hypothetical protein
MDSPASSVAHLRTHRSAIVALHDLVRSEAIRQLIEIGLKAEGK